MHNLNAGFSIVEVTVSLFIILSTLFFITQSALYSLHIIQLSNQQIFAETQLDNLIELIHTSHGLPRDQMSNIQQQLALQLPEGKGEIIKIASSLYQAKVSWNADNYKSLINGISFRNELNQHTISAQVRL